MEYRNVEQAQTKKSYCLQNGKGKDSKHEHPKQDHEILILKKSPPVDDPSDVPIVMNFHFADESAFGVAEANWSESA